MQVTRATLTVVAVLVLCLVAPLVAALAQTAIPTLLGALVLLAVVHLARRPSRRR
jgi:hypothetical protein